MTNDEYRKYVISTEASECKNYFERVKLRFAKSTLGVNTFRNLKYHAEALINHLGDGVYNAVSAGSKPSGFVHPKSIETLRRNGVEVGSPRSKSWDEFEGQSFDLVITVCDAAASEACPVFFGSHKKLHWPTPDPANAKGSEEEINAAFDEAYNKLKARIESELL